MTSTAEALPAHPAATDGTPSPRAAFQPDIPAAMVVPWHTATRVAFRFCVLYLGLYVVTTQMLSGMFPLPGVRIPDLGATGPMQALVAWVGATVLGIAEPVTLPQSGSGDKLYDWTLAFTVLVMSLAGTLLWSWRARGARSYPRLYKWFRLFVRVALGTTMLTYGLAKVIPLQMPTLSLTRLVEPFGDFSPMGVLWYSIGASPAYEIFIGVAELVAGLLLFVRRTVLLGALLCLAVGTGVFAVNMTYDVPVKLFSFHLLLFSLFLLAPHARSLVSYFLLARPVAPAREPAVGRTPGTQRLLTILLALYGLWVTGAFAWQNVQTWKTYGPHAPRSPLFGIWAVQSLTMNGVEKPLVVTDTTLYRHVIFQSPTSATFQRMNDAFLRYGAKIDTASRTVTLTETTLPGTPAAATTSPPQPFSLAYVRPTPNVLLLQGFLEGRSVSMRLHLRPHDEFELRRRGFHWIQEFPYNR